MRWYIGATPCTSDFCIEHRRALSLRCSLCLQTHLDFVTPICTYGPVVRLNDPVLSQLERTLDCRLQE